MATLFNDIDNIIGNSDNSDDINDIILSSYIQKAVCKALIKHHSNHNNVYLVGKLRYKLENNIAFFTDDAYVKDNVNEECDGLIYPFGKDNTTYIIKFNKYNNVDYIKGELMLYNSGNVLLEDNELYLIEFCNYLFNEYNITVNEIIYGTSQKQIQSFGVCLFNERRGGDHLQGLSEQFCLNFPKITVNNKNITKSFRFDKIGFENEDAFITLCKRLYKLYSGIDIQYNVATTFINYKGLFNDKSYFSDEFYKLLTVNVKEDHSITLDQVYILNKKDVINYNKI